MRRYVWDWVVRLCHLVFILGCLAAYLSYQMGQMDLHAWCGYAVLAALALRLLWAVIGSPTARFSSFVRSPACALTYLRRWRHEPAPVGHNPLGGYAVVALFAALAAETLTGLFSDDEVATSGPLRGLVTDQTAQTLTHLHRMTFDILLALVGLHLAAILAYAIFKRVNLVGPMITGWMRDEDA